MPQGSTFNKEVHGLLHKQQSDLHCSIFFTLISYLLDILTIDPVTIILFDPV